MPDSTPDLTRGYPLRDLPDGGIVAGHVGDAEVVLARNGETLFAVGASCTHYHGPLKDGLVVGDTIRCPWHHACFSLRTGEAVRPPALDPVTCWRVEREGDQVFVREKIAAAPSGRRPPVSPASVVIVGGGGAGLSAAVTLRQEGYEGPITILSADDAPPCDRPNLSKDFLAGTAKEDWIPLRSAEFYAEQRITLKLNARVWSIDGPKKRVLTEGGAGYDFGALLIATGAEPIRLDIEGAPASDVQYLRTFADSRAIVAGVSRAKRAIVIGASFIGLEVAASLRTRGLEVHVVAPEKQPLERVMGPEIGAFIRTLHEEHGVTFHLGTTIARMDQRTATLSDGTTVSADIVIAGIGVRPSLSLAEGAGLALDRGVTVNEYLETSQPGIYAAGDIARWPDPHTGDRIRVEHWVVAERQGQVAAKNMLGLRERFDAVPFFWSQHYDVSINYVGHAESWDRIDLDGSLADRDCTATYRRGGRALAVATIYRDRASLEAEAGMERSGG